MKPKYDLLKAIGPGIRNNLMPPSTLPTDLQVLLLRLAMQEASGRTIGAVVMTCGAKPA